MSDSSDLLKQFFYERTINGKVYRTYTVNSVGLLSLTSNEALCDARKIIDVVKRGNIDILILLLTDRNWRTQIIGVIGSFAFEYQEQVISKMWELFDQGNWISPQIAVSLFLQDKDFIEKAMVRIDIMCKTKNETVIKQYKRTITSSKKALISLLVLCRQVPSLENWANKKLISQEFKEIVMSPDMEQINNLCVNWMRLISVIKPDYL